MDGQEEARQEEGQGNPEDIEGKPGSVDAPRHACSPPLGLVSGFSAPGLPGKEKKFMGVFRASEAAGGQGRCRAPPRTVDSQIVLTEALHSADNHPEPWPSIASYLSPARSPLCRTAWYCRCPIAIRSTRASK